MRPSMRSPPLAEPWPFSGGWNTRSRLMKSEKAQPTTNVAPQTALAKRRIHLPSYLPTDAPSSYVSLLDRASFYVPALVDHCDGSP